jgi:ubiquinone/menaquinone biosynthesis C-methylase UbiE
VVLIKFLFGSSKQKKEGFTFEKNFLEKKGDEIFDDFYASIYDDLLFSDVKNDYEIGEIISKTSPTSESNILDIGSGTGHHVKALKDKGLKVSGIDKSESMVKEAKKQHPDINVKVGDASKSMELEPAQYTHITCLYFTIYYFSDKLTFFRNCYNWLKPGGYLIVHMVNKNEFNPIVPAGDPFAIVSPQKYAKERITTTTVKFNDFTYKSQFNPPSDQSASPESVVFKEIFKDNTNGNVRQNTHQLYMEEQETILEKARSVGFIEHAQIDMVNCQYDHQFLYILQKPN